MKSNLNSVTLGGIYKRYILSFNLEDLFNPARKKVYCMYVLNKSWGKACIDCSH